MPCAASHWGLMRVRCRLLCVSVGAALAAGAADAEREAAPLVETVLEFRLEGGGAVVARAWTAGDEIYASRGTLTALGVAAGVEERIALSSVPGLSYRLAAAAQAVEMRCTRACFAVQHIRAPRIDAPLLPTRGFLLDADLAASWIDGEGEAGGLFGLGVFTEAGAGDARWTMSAKDAAIVRLDTRWSVDFPASRTRLTLGDALAPLGGEGAPVRFGGLRFGTDFALDPRFVTFDTPVIEAEAASASVVELYVDGALQLRERVAQGPFAIMDAPVAAGAGAAQVVVTDVMGRERVIEAQFYAAPTTLKRGLAAYDLSLGAVRRGYGRRSFDYGQAFAAGAYRRGVGGGATLGVRGDLRDRDGGIGGSVGGAASFVDPDFGQIDLDLAASHDDAGQGGFAQLGWTRIGRVVQASLQATASAGAYRPLGASFAPPRVMLRGALSAALRDGGAAQINAAMITPHDGARRAVYGLSYANAFGGFGALSLSALAVEEKERSFYVGLSFTRAFGADGVVAASAAQDAHGFTSGARFAHTPPRGEGLGWRAGAAFGAQPRSELGLVLRGRTYDARLDASRAGEREGVRAQVATTIASVGGAWSLIAPAADSFALVDVGAPGVAVRHEGRVVGRTDGQGRLMVAGLRPYDVNRIAIEVDDLPLRARVDIDERTLRPSGRGGVVVRLAAENGAAGEVRIVNGRGPLPRGAMLARDGDGARFPVGDGGRIYVSAAAGAQVLRGAGCVVRIRAQDIGGVARCLGGDDDDDP